MLVGCVQDDLSAVASTSGSPGSHSKQPEEAASFALGLPLQPAAALLVWLEASSNLLRLPVVLSADDSMQGVIGLDREAAAAPDAIHLTLSDTAMGISLATQLREACPVPIWSARYSWTGTGARRCRSLVRTG